jgi:hypothetical protein
MMRFRGMGDSPVIATIDPTFSSSTVVMPQLADITQPVGCVSVEDCALQSLPLNSVPWGTPLALSAAAAAPAPTNWLLIAGVIFGSLFFLELAGSMK